MPIVRLVVSPLLTASCLLLASIAVADGQDSAVAEALYSDSITLMERGDFATACAKLEESHRLDPAVGTLLYLGECYDKLGRTASAWTTFMSAADAAQRAKQTDREQMARERVRELSARVPKLVISVPPHARIPGLQIFRDETPIREPLWGTPTAADPGQHVVTALAPNRQTWKSVVALPASPDPVTVEIPMLLDANPAAVPPPPLPAPPPQSAPGGNQATPPAAPAEPSTKSNPWPTIGWIAAGAGVVGLGVGVGFGLDAKSKEDESKDYCWGRNDNLCSSKGVSLIDDAKNSATISTVGFVAGGVLLAGGAAILLFAPSPTETSEAQPQVQLTPAVGPGNAGLFLDGRF